VPPVQLLDLLKQAIADGVFPGACYAGSGPDRSIIGCEGQFTYSADSPAVKEGTLWDLASVTKVFATTTVAMILSDEGKLNLDRPVSDDLPAFGVRGKERITPRNLLLHNAGLAPFRAYEQKCASADEVIDTIFAEELEAPVGQQTVYSDLGLIVFGKLLEYLGGSPLDILFRDLVARPLGLINTMFNPVLELRARCAPTEPIEPWRREMWRAKNRLSYNVNSEWIQGEVHDPRAAFLGGVAGHAGLFSTVGDLSQFAQFMLDKGRAGDKQVVRSETVEEWTSCQSESSSRALGWDTRTSESSCGPLFSCRTFGHTGFTGTSVWIDPGQRMYSVLLTNRVHPSAANQRLADFRPLFNTAVAETLLHSS